MDYDGTASDGTAYNCARALWTNQYADFALGGAGGVDLAAEGFALTGGRLDYLDGRTVAALVYRSGPHVINVFVWPMADAKPQAPAFSTRQGYQLAHWTQGGMQA